MKPLGYIYFLASISLIAMALSYASTNYILAIIAVSVTLIALLLLGIINDDHFLKK